MLVVLAITVWTLRLASIVLTVGIVVGSLLRLISLSALVGLTCSHLVRDGDLFSNSIPNCIDAVSVVKTLKNTVTADHDEVKVVLDFKTLDIWITDNDVWITAIAWSLCFNVSKRL
jgi:hypothetical protein